MNDWRRYPSENYHQEVPRTPTRSYNRKPPTGSWQPTVPLWEKKFCTLVGSMPWRRLVEAKKILSYYTNVLQWNDSAGEEAFNNAKSRFWAKINGLPCDISLPNPDMYIDEIDWNSDIDPELVLDLEQEPVAPEEKEQVGKPGICADSLFFLNHPIKTFTGWGDAEDDPIKTCTGWGGAEDDPIKTCTGWGGAEDDPIKTCTGWDGAEDDPIKTCTGWDGAEDDPIKTCTGWDGAEDDPIKTCTGWGDAEDDPIKKANNSSFQPSLGDSYRNAGNEDNPWERDNVGGNGAVENKTLGDCGDNSWGGGQWENNINDSVNLASRRTSVSGGWGTWNENGRKREGTSRYMSRYKTSRFQGDDYQTDHGWRGGRGRKRVNFGHERLPTVKKPWAPWQWNSIHSCGPVSHHGSGGAGNPWSWEKQVS